MFITMSRAVVTTGAVAGLSLVGTGAAAAHVTADAPEATQGSTAVITLKVPTESVTAATTGLRVELPRLSSVRTEPLPGWSARIDRNADNEVVAVTWTADPGNPGVRAEEFQRFVITAGPLPRQDTVALPATQTYSDGSVVAWNQPMGPDGSEPEYPSPQIHPVEGDGEDGHGAAAASSSAQHDRHDTDGTARWLGAAGLALGAVGALLGLGSMIRGRRS